MALANINVSSGGGKKTPMLVSVPVQSGTLTYDGSAQSPTWSGYDATQLTIGGTTSATDAGTYTVTFTLKSGYTWTDGTVSPKNVTWTIGKGVLTLSASIPSAVTYFNPVMTGNAAYGTITVTGNTGGGTITATSSDTSVVTVQGTSANSVTVKAAKGTGSATITIQVPETAKYLAASTTCTVVTQKATPPLQLELYSTLSIIQTPPGTTTTVGINSYGQSAVTVTSSNPAVATCSASNFTESVNEYVATNVSIQTLKEGLTTITVSKAATDNYTGASAMFQVACREPKAITDDWATISTRSKDGTAANYYDIGDYKEITLNGDVGGGLTLQNTTLRVFILHINLPMNGVAENNIIWGGFKTTGGTYVALIDDLYDKDSTDGTACFNLNHWGATNYGGWKGCDLRYDILGATSTQPSDYGQKHTTANVGYNATAATLTNPKANTLLAALPADFRNALRLWSRWIDAKGNCSNVDANIEETIDAVTLLTTFERDGHADGSANKYEKGHATPMMYFVSKNYVSPKSFSTLKATKCWSPSAKYNSDTIFCGFNFNITNTPRDTSYSLALAPAFKT